MANEDIHIKILEKKKALKEKQERELLERELKSLEKEEKSNTKTGRFFKGLGNFANNSLKVADNILTNMEKADAKTSKPKKNKKSKRGKK